MQIYIDICLWSKIKPSGTFKQSESIITLPTALKRAREPLVNRESYIHIIATVQKQSKAV